MTEPLSLLYAAAVGLRGWLYDRSVLPARLLPVPVISVGNLSAGGTGKTPMVAMVARILAGLDARPVIVSRGYGGAHRSGPRVVSEGSGPLATALEAGDEPVMLAGLLPGVPIIISRRRREGGELAVSRFKAGCVVLDDGFQHRALARDLDLLLVDAHDAFGNGRMLPWGPLRERLPAMRRAGAIVMTRCDRFLPASLETIAGHAARFCPAAPIFHARTRPVALVDVASGTTMPPVRLRGTRTACFAGIARPERFFQDVEAAGAIVTARLPFPDHHRFSDAEAATISAAASSSKADLLLTTEKDAARLSGTPAARRLEGLHALRVQTVVDEQEAFASLLAGTLS